MGIFDKIFKRDKTEIEKEIKESKKLVHSPEKLENWKKQGELSQEMQDTSELRGKKKKLIKEIQKESANTKDIKILKQNEDRLNRLTAECTTCEKNVEHFKKEIHDLQVAEKSL